MTHTCPICRGYRLERQWCGFCKGTGQVADRRQSQRRKQGRRDGDDLLAEAMELLKAYASMYPLVSGQALHYHTKEFLEKINDR